MRSTVLSLFATAILASSATIPGFAMNIGAHVSPGISAMRIAPPSGINSVPPHGMSNISALTIRGGTVPLKHKRPGKLNGACYRSCVKTSMGDATRTDQFCAYSCSLD